MLWEIPVDVLEVLVNLLAHLFKVLLEVLFIFKFLLLLLKPLQFLFHLGLYIAFLNIWYEFPCHRGEVLQDIFSANLLWLCLNSLG